MPPQAYRTPVLGRIAGSGSRVAMRWNIVDRRRFLLNRTPVGRLTR